MIRERCGVQVDLVTKIEKEVFRWFRAVDRMNEERLTKQIYKWSLSVQVPKGRSRRIHHDQNGDV